MPYHHIERPPRHTCEREYLQFWSRHSVVKDIPFIETHTHTNSNSYPNTDTDTLTNTQKHYNETKFIPLATGREQFSPFESIKFAYKYKRQT